MLSFLQVLNIQFSISLDICVLAFALQKNMKHELMNLLINRDAFMSVTFSNKSS